MTVEIDGRDELSASQVINDLQPLDIPYQIELLMDVLTWYPGVEIDWHTMVVRVVEAEQPATAPAPSSLSEITVVVKADRT